jgi:hypothetical protein
VPTQPRSVTRLLRTSMRLPIDSVEIALAVAISILESPLEGRPAIFAELA